MKPQFVLSALWLCFLIAGIAVLESYIHLNTPEGKRYLLEEDRTDCLVPVAKVYGLYFGGILTFWFLKPFRAPASDKASRLRFILAFACTLVFNCYILFLLTSAYFDPPMRRDVLTDVSAAVAASKWLSFIVAPVNVYYFGSKAQ